MASLPLAGLEAREPNDPALPSSTERLPFGFRDLEMYKVEGSALGLQVADLDGDGRQDFAVANNSDGTIRLFLRGSGSEATPTTPPERNVAPSDTRFRVEKVYTDKQIDMLEVGDLDADGRLDLAFYSDPPELEVIYQGPGGFTSEGSGARRERFPIRDGADTSWGMKCADLDADGRSDLVLLGKGAIHILRQRESGGLTAPESIPCSPSEIGGLELADWNQDGRLDLLLLEPSATEPTIVRLQGSDGFGPERRARLQPLQSWAVAHFPTPESPPTLFTIHASTRRVKAYTWRESDTTAGLGAAQVVPLGEGAGDESSVRLLADIDGDGRLDLLVGDPETARLEARLQDDSGSLARRGSYPTLAAVNGLAFFDADGDGRSEVVVTSAKERAIGFSAWEEGRLQIPRSLLLEGEPVLLRHGPLLGSARSHAFLVERHDDAFRLRVGRLDGAEAFEVVATTKIETRGSAPSDLRLLDANGDGGADVLLTVPYEPPLLFLQAAGEDGVPTFREVARDPTSGFVRLGKLEPAALSILRARPEGSNGPSTSSRRDRLLVSSGSYVRAFELDERARLQLVDQFNGRSASARIAAATPIDLDRDGSDEVVLLDSSTSSLDVLRRGPDGVYSPAESLPLRKVDLRSMETADLNGDGRQDLVLLGRREVVILHAGEHEGTFAESLTHTLEPEELGRPQDLALGDLNGDTFPDLIVTTAPKYHVVLLSAVGSKPSSPTAEVSSGSPFERVELQQGLAFQIFEEKSYMRRATTLGPERMTCADMDGDGLLDLVLLIHDRVHIYYQDSLR